MGDDFKKVRSGDPLRFSANLHNRLVDIVRGQAGQQHNIGAPPVTAASEACVAHARNDSSEAAPMYGVCQITGWTANDSEILTFDQYSAAASGACGILLEPIPDGAVGKIAVQGGPVKLRVTGIIAAGDELGPTNASWNAQIVTSSASWRALTPSYGGTCLAVWQAASAGDPAYTNITIGSTSEQDTALTDSWTRSFGPVGNTLTEIRAWRHVYNPTGDQMIYTFYRTTVKDALGVYHISAETRKTIAEPVVAGPI